jgi:adenosylcobinamide-GDP ribazoletransferase
MGVVGITLVLLAKWACLSEMSLKIKDVALLIMPTLGRWSMVLAAFISPYAREEEGLGKPFAGKIKPSVFWTSGVFALTTSVVLLGIDGVSLFLLIALLSIGLVELIKRRMGGMTGDTLGAICELIEVLTLLVILVEH